MPRQAKHNILQFVELQRKYECDSGKVDLLQVGEEEDILIYQIFHLFIYTATNFISPLQLPPFFGLRFKSSN